jgi:hypothetical protein
MAAINIYYYYYNKVPHSLENIEFSKDEVLSLLSKLPETSSPGPDNILPKVLKVCAQELCEPLSFIMSSSFQSSVLPDSRLKANITPIFKNGDKTKAENYRPISLTSVSCKLMEKIISTKIISFLNQHDLIDKNQPGFLPRRSVIMCMLYSMDYWTSCIDKCQSLNISGIF